MKICVNLRYFAKAIAREIGMKNVFFNSWEEENKIERPPLIRKEDVIEGEIYDLIAHVTLSVAMLHRCSLMVFV